MRTVRATRPRQRVLIADDHPLVRHGLRDLVASSPCCRVVAEASDGAAAVALSKQLQPDVAVLDISMPRLNGLDAARLIRRDAPRTAVLILSMHFSGEVLQEVMRAGARGFVLKSDAEEDLLAALQAIRRGRAFFTPRIRELGLDAAAGFPAHLPGNAMPPGETPLTPREIEILRLLAGGMSNREVASALGLSARTVETHRSRLMAKLQLRSFSELVRYAIRHNFVAP